jgi:hypothetical protein
MMANFIQSFLEWFSAHASVLTQIGAALVVIIGGLWQVYIYVDGKKEKLKQTPPNPPPNPGIRIVLPPAAPPLPDMQRAPLVMIEGRYRPATYPKATRRAMMFGCAFLLFWCLVLFWGVGSGLGSLKPVFPNSLFLIAFILPPIFMLYIGTAIFLSQVMMLMGKVLVYAGADMVLISRSLGEFFSNHTVILASEWRFDGEVFVSRREGTKIPLPHLPEYARSELIKALNAIWR